jgi:hypothetical protein
MISKRYRHYFVTVGNSIYSIESNDGNTYLNIAEQYNITTDKWISIASVEKQHNKTAAISIGELIFVLGESDGSTDFNSIEMYDVRSNK